MCIVFFSYMPLLYLVNTRQGKLAIYASMVAVALVLAFIDKCLQSENISFNRHSVTALALYIVFALYAFGEYVLAPGQNTSTVGSETIRTIVVVNTVAAILAFACLRQKRVVLVTLAGLATTYVLLFGYSVFHGAIRFDAATFQSIFPDLDVTGGYYQNINEYFGMFIISVLCLTEPRGYLRTVARAACAGVLVGMFVIGGRAPVVAIVVVLACRYLVVRRTTPFTMGTLAKNIVVGSLVVLALVVAFNRDGVTNVLDDMLTMRRFKVIAETGDESTRLFLFSKAVELWMSDASTFAFRGGISSFPASISEYSRGMYPHNIVLELLSEYGLCGFILFSLPFVYVGVVRYKVLGSIVGTSGDERAVFFLVVYFTTLYLFTGGVVTSWYLIYFGFLLLPNAVTVESLRDAET